MLFSCRAGTKDYIAAIGFCAVFLGLRYTLDPMLEDRAPLLVLLVAVILSAWCCGIGPGLLATAATTLVGTYFFVSTRNSLHPDTSVETARVVIYVAVCLLVTWVIGSREASHRAAIEAARKGWIDALEEKVRERTAVAEARTTQLRALAGELAQAEQRERKRVAHILHDHYQQMLIAAKNGLEMLRRRLPDQERQSADEILEIVMKVIEESRTLAVELAPPLLYKMGLPAALQWLAETSRKRYGLMVELHADAAADPGNDALREVLFQAANELLFNAHKHGGVTNATVSLSREGGHVQLTVSDSGHGFDPQSLSRDPGSAGFGLLSLRERLAYFGGQLTIDSAPGKGTRATAEIPSQEEVAPAAKPPALIPTNAPVRSAASMTRGSRGSSEPVG